MLMRVCYVASPNGSVPALRFGIPDAEYFRRPCGKTVDAESRDFNCGALYCFLFTVLQSVCREGGELVGSRVLRELGIFGVSEPPSLNIPIRTSALGRSRCFQVACRRFGRRRLFFMIG